MAQITAALVKQLRDKTGAGMMDCKKALTETDGELEAAVDWLRKSGLAQAARKAGRTAAEGLIGMATVPGKAAMVEINAETDFVARNDDFQAVVREVAKIALDCEGDLERLSAASYPGTGCSRCRRDHQSRRHHRREHSTAANGRSFHAGGRRRRLHPHADRRRPGQARRAGRRGVRSSCRKS